MAFLSPPPSHFRADFFYILDFKSSLQPYKVDGIELGLYSLK